MKTSLNAIILVIVIITTSNAQTVVSIKGYGIDYSDNSQVCIFSEYPNIRMDDDPRRCSVANVKWTGDYSISNNILTLYARDIRTDSEPLHELGIGYTVAISGAKFDDGTTTKSFIIYKFTRRPTKETIKLEIPLIEITQTESKEVQQDDMAVASIQGYGYDFTDRSPVCFVSNYPNIIMDDNHLRCRIANAKWTGDYELKKDKLILKILNLGTDSPPAKTLGVGFTVTLTGALFSDGSRTRSFILYKFNWNPSRRDIIEEIPIIPKPILKDIQEYVNLKIRQFQLRGEFEKTQEYALRMQKLPEKIKEYITEAFQYYGVWKSAKLNLYDADRESYKISIPVIGNIVLPVPINVAKEFKELWTTAEFKPDFQVSGKDWILFSLAIRIPKLNKSFVYDSHAQVDYNPTPLTFATDNVDVSISGSATSSERIDETNVEENIPKTNRANSDAIAVIIGNAKYEKVKPVVFAENDTRSIKKYLVNTLGFKEGNIFLVPNAKKSDFELYFGTEQSFKGKLFNTMKEAKSDIFVFYSGHGAPGLKDKQGYFVPTDCDPNYLELQGYPLSLFFHNLSQLQAKSITIAFDACFSGATVYEKISPALLKLEKPNIQLINYVALSSSSGEQVSSWYNDKQHGLFTYFLLKAIHSRNADANKDGKLTFNEIYNYISDKSEGLPYYARRLNGIEQNPTIQGDMQDKVWVVY